MAENKEIDISESLRGFNGACLNSIQFERTLLGAGSASGSGFGKPGAEVVCEYSVGGATISFTPQSALETPTDTHKAIQAILDLARANPSKTSGFTATEITIEMNENEGTPVDPETLDPATNSDNLVPALTADGEEVTVDGAVLTRPDFTAPADPTPVVDAAGNPVLDANGVQIEAVQEGQVSYTLEDVRVLLVNQTTNLVFCQSLNEAGVSNYLINGGMTWASSDNVIFDRPMGCSGNNTFFTKDRSPPTRVDEAALTPSTTNRTQRRLEKRDAIVKSQRGSERQLRETRKQLEEVTREVERARKEAAQAREQREAVQNALRTAHADISSLHAEARSAQDNLKQHLEVARNEHKESLAEVLALIDSLKKQLHQQQQQQPVEKIVASVSPSDEEEEEVVVASDGEEDHEEKEVGDDEEQQQQQEDEEEAQRGTLDDDGVYHMTRKEYESQKRNGTFKLPPGTKTVYVQGQ